MSKNNKQAVNSRQTAKPLINSKVITRSKGKPITTRAKLNIKRQNFLKSDLMTDKQKDRHSKEPTQQAISKASSIKGSVNKLQGLSRKGKGQNSQTKSSVESRQKSSLESQIQLDSRKDRQIPKDNKPKLLPTQTGIRQRKKIIYEDNLEKSHRTNKQKPKIRPVVKSIKKDRQAAKKSCQLQEQECQKDEVLKQPDVRQNIKQAKLDQDIDDPNIIEEVKKFIVHPTQPQLLVKFKSGEEQELEFDEVVALDAYKVAKFMLTLYE